MSDIMLSQSYAIRIENILCGVFSCERCGVGGIVNSDYIRRWPVTSMIHAAIYVYSKANDIEKKAIEEYIHKVTFYSEWSIDQLLSFESKEKIIDGITYQLEFENGKQQLEHIIQEFEELIRFN